MLSILITGGAGYIGSHTCVELIKNGYNPIILDNYSNSSFEAVKRVEMITGVSIKSFNCDIRDEKNLLKIFKENKIDAVIHFAGLKSVGESCREPLMYYDNNIYGTIVLCRVMEKFGVKKFIFSSSATVYGDAPPPYTESMNPGKIANPYGRTKYVVEKMLSDLCKSDDGWTAVLLRYFNPIGAHESGKIGEDPEGLPNNIMPLILRNACGVLPELTIYGDDYDTPDGTCIRDYVHVLDIASGHVSAIKKLFESNGIYVYNLGTGKGCSVFELINTFERVLGKSLRYSIGKRREGDLPVCFADTKKAERELGWLASRDIEQMCIDSWRWQYMNPNGYKQ